MTSHEEHEKKIAEAINYFYQECGDEDTWNTQERRWRDLLLARINVEDGYSPVVDGRTILFND